MGWRRRHGQCRGGMKGCGCAKRDGTVAICDLRTGQCGRVCSALMSESDAALLRSMGLRDSSRVRVCRCGEPYIVAVETGNGAFCRIGLARDLAQQILVVPDDAA